VVYWYKKKFLTRQHSTGSFGAKEFLKVSYGICMYIYGAIIECYTK